MKPSIAGMLACSHLLCAPLPAAWIWQEGEDAAETSAQSHPWYGGQVDKNQLSGRAFLSHFGETGPVRSVYRFEAPAAGRYTLWMRANPVQTRYTWALNDRAPEVLDMARDKTGEINLAPDGAPDLRFLAWTKAGEADLRKGGNVLTFTMEGKAGKDYHGSLDCFVFTQEPFTPMGTAKPDEIAARLEKVAGQNKGWTVWNPPTDPHEPSPMDLRRLNERVAGMDGRVAVKDGRFVLGGGTPVRFWGVNGPDSGLKGDALRQAARDLAKRGVNLVRHHGAVFDPKTGRVDLAKVRHLHDTVAAMKQEGIYTHLSIYFPLWMTPESGLPFLQGYDGSKHPFGALIFNPEFQKVYQDWWKAVLTTPPAGGGPALLDDPAVMGVEIQNEDSLFFWTFSDDNVPPPQRRLIQKAFGGWAAKKYGSHAAALKAWNGSALPEDDAAAGRLAMRPLYQIFTDRTRRDQDTAVFLMETQRRFYAEQTAFLRRLGYRGLITASNWTTAHDRILGPLEKYSYTTGDFIDRHGYWGGTHRGDHAAWSIRNGHEFADRSALRFDPSTPGGKREITHPAFDTKYNGLPSMISETTFSRPNRYRTEAPAFYAAYGALQGSDSIVHFAHDGAQWSVKPGFFMQPWTLMTPTQIGQFPAAALIYRQGLLAEGKLMADIRLPLASLAALEGTPMATSANLDELRRADTPDSALPAATGTIDPIIHLIGRTQTVIAEQPGTTKLENPAPFHDPAARTVTASTGEIKLDYGHGVLRLSGAKAQGIVGNLEAAGETRLPLLTVKSNLDLGAVLLVPLDGAPLATSRQLLLQVMTEERPTDFAAEPADKGLQRLTQIGTDPWLIREPRGTVQFTFPGSPAVSVQPLDANGYPKGPKSDDPALTLRPDTVYYLIGK